MAELNVMQEIEQFFANLFRSNDPKAVVDALNNPDLALRQAGINPAQLQGVNLTQAYNNACLYPGVPSEYSGALQGYDHQPSFHEVVRQVQEVHQNIINQSFDDHSTNVDSSTHFQGDVSVEGDFNFDPTTNTASDHSVAGDGTVGVTGNDSAASGSGDVANDGGRVVDVSGPNFGNINAGDNSAQVGGNTLLGFGSGGDPILTRTLGEGGGLPGSGGPITINTGGGTQQVANNLGGDGHNQTSFGSGSNTQLENSPVTNSAIGDHAHNTSGNTLDHGSSLASDGGQSQGHEEIHTHTETQFTEGDNSPLFTQHAEGEHIHQHLDAQPEHHVLDPGPVS